VSAPALAAEPSSTGNPGRVEPNDLESLREANRLLEEEIKLASRPQLYMLLDLGEKVLLVKGRGVELHRFAIDAWCLSGEKSIAGLYRLHARPIVSRPKAVPGHDPSLEPINVQDMPAEYMLVYDPGLFLAVAPTLRAQPWLWARSLLREWWTRLGMWIRFAAEGDPLSVAPTLRLTVSPDAARSLAWTVTDGMPLLVGKTALP